MKSALTVVLFRLFTIGVFVDGNEASNVSVMEGDSVTLKPGVTDVHINDIIEWRFNGNSIDTFVDTLQLDSQTGDLKISNIRTKDSGLYKVQISSSTGSSEMEFNVNVLPTGAAKAVILNEGDFITLRTDVPDIHRVDEIRWRFGLQKSSVAEINRMGRNFIRYDGPDDRFTGRLTLDKTTGSLIITNTKITDSGLYEADISSGKHTIHKSFNVTVRDYVKSVLLMERDSVTLHTGLTGIQRDDEILWKFEHQDIARLNGSVNKTRRNIDLSSMTGDLTIRNIRRDQRGDYKVEIITRRMILHSKYSITVDAVKSVSVKEGESVTLHIVTEIQKNDELLWMFGGAIIAEIYEASQLSYKHNGSDGRFRDRLQLDNQTGSLTITNTRTTDSGNYKAEITGRRYTINKIITVTVSGVFGDTDEVMSVMKGNRVTLNTGVTKNPDDTFLWYFEETLIALVNRHPNTSCLYYGEGEIFKDRLDVDYKTGSLIITTFRPEHTGRYEAEFIKHDNTGKTKTFVRSSKCDQTKINPKGSDLVIQKSFNLTVSGSGLSSGAVAGIVVVLLAAAVVAVVVMYYRRKISELKRQRVENGVNRNKQKTDDPATEETNLANDS